MLAVMRRWIVLVSLSALFCVCSADKAPCVDYDEACGTSCSQDAECGPGLYCHDGECAKQCDPSQGFDCLPGSVCSANGQCVLEAGDGGAAGTAGSGAAGGSVAGGGGAGGGSGGAGGGSGGAGGGSGGAGGEDTCAEQHVEAEPVTPTVVLIVDQSASMDDGFGRQGSRWDVLRDFLLEQPGGLISDLQSDIRFGLALYSADSDGGPTPIGECPMVTMVPPALDNYQSISDVYRSADTIRDTPTGDSIDAIVESMGLQQGLAPGEDPVIFILATDGMPDRCEELNPQNGQQEAVDAVERARELGIRTYAIWIGPSDQEVIDHMQDIADAGAGVQGAEYWVAGDDATLREALTAIVTGQLSCEIQLEGSVEEGDICLGTVVLNGGELDCNDPDGFIWVGPSLIRLQGQACDTLTTSVDVDLDISFPCGVDVGPIL